MSSVNQERDSSCGTRDNAERRGETELTSSQQSEHGSFARRAWERRLLEERLKQGRLLQRQDEPIEDVSGSTRD